MTAAVLADFGSTFTKVSVVEVGTGRLLARAQAPTTIHSDVIIGYESALAAARSRISEPVTIGPRLAASSAAGGLRVAAVGLVEDLTVAAARQAALNAGARIELVLDGRLTEHHGRKLKQVNPEVVLFSGGTDGGQEQIVIDNAEVLATAAVDAHFVVACNEAVAEKVARILGRHDARVDVVANVMPCMGTLDVAPARDAISEAFVTHVIAGKGLSSSAEFGRSVIMPTPEAVLRATALLADGHADLEGFGEVLSVDVGGATTDVHSAGHSGEITPGVNGPLLPVPPVMRSVEGDLGLRSNAESVIRLDGAWITEQLTSGGGGAVQALSEAGRERSESPSLIATSRAELEIDSALACSCLFHALRRHCGHLKMISSPNQPVRISFDGPDLRDAPLLVGTGGILANTAGAEQILSAAIARREARSLAPTAPRVVIDSNYILAAAGLLASIDERSALLLMHHGLSVMQPES